VAVSFVVGVVQINTLYTHWRMRAEAVSELVRAAGFMADSRDYAGAWDLLERVRELDPGSRDVRRARTDLAMRWLRDMRIRGENSWTSTVGKLFPALYGGVVSARGRRLADIYAHLGKANSLWKRDGQDLPVKELYDRALAIDPANTYAHALLGQWIILDPDGSLAEANEHFAAAVQENRDITYVRKVQLMALCSRIGTRKEFLLELMRAANDARRDRVDLSTGDRGYVFRTIYGQLHRSWKGAFEKKFAAVLEVLPADEHLATYRWLDVDEQAKTSPFHALWRARLIEASGDLEAALEAYREITAMRGYGRFSGKDDVEEAIRRISLTISLPGKDH